MKIAPAPRIVSALLTGKDVFVSAETFTFWIKEPKVSPDVVEIEPSNPGQLQDYYRNIRDGFADPELHSIPAETIMNLKMTRVFRSALGYPVMKKYRYDPAAVRTYIKINDGKLQDGGRDFLTAASILEMTTKTLESNLEALVQEVQVVYNDRGGYFFAR